MRLVPGVRGRWQGILSADTVCSRRLRQKLKWAVAAEHGTWLQWLEAGPEAPFLPAVSLLSPSPPHGEGTAFPVRHS